MLTLLIIKYTFKSLPWNGAAIVDCKSSGSNTNILRTFVLIVASDILKLSTWVIWFGVGWAPYKVQNGGYKAQRGVYFGTS